MKAAALMSLLSACMLCTAQTNPLDPERGAFDWKPLPPHSDLETLPETEQVASQYLLQLVADLGREHGLSINSISARKTKLLESGQREIRAYLGYDAELDQLIGFMRGLAMSEVGVWVEMINISARRKIHTRELANSGRPHLNGNMVVACLADGETTRATAAEESGTSVGGEPLAALTALDGLVNHLPAAAWVTNVQIKQRDILQVQGYTEQTAEVAHFFETHPAFADARLHESSDEQRFIYRVTIDHH